MVSRFGGEIVHRTAIRYPSTAKGLLSLLPFVVLGGVLDALTK